MYNFIATRDYFVANKNSRLKQKNVKIRLFIIGLKIWDIYRCYDNYLFIIFFIYLDKKLFLSI